VRINLGLFRHDVNVLWDLAAHDLAIMDYLLPQRPCAVSATGVNHVEGGPEDVAYITLFFDDKLIAHVHANWLSPVKIRQTLIGGREKMILYNDLEAVDKVKVFDRGIVVRDDPEARSRIGYRTGEMRAPAIDATEALRTLADHFVRCVDGLEQPISGGDAGLRVVQILEAASQSIASNGRPVELARRALLA
jgi:predicted dehydrogenase